MALSEEAQAAVDQYQTELAGLVQSALDGASNEIDLDRWMCRSFAQLAKIPVEDVRATHTQRGGLLWFDVTFRPPTPPTIMTVTFTVPEEQTDGTQD